MKTYDGATDITKDVALEALMTCELRVTRRATGWKEFPDETYEEILYDDLWRHLCRTDLYDDVCTWHPLPWTEVPEPITEVRKRWIDKVQETYGVRIGPERFAIIDAMTDG